MEYARIQSKERNGEANMERARGSANSIGRSSPLFNLAPPLVSLASNSPLSNGMLQRKLTISQPEDEYEQEADRVAERVMRMPEPPFRIQRKCGCAEGASSSKCEECGGAQPLVRRRAAPQTGKVNRIPGIIDDVLRSPGQAMNRNTLAFFENRFGRDFSHVRVHADAEAADSARTVNARAYTVGHHLVFGAGEYSPQSSAGQHLIAHELAHVVQQGASAVQATPSSLLVQRTCFSPPLRPVEGCSAVEGDFLGEHFLFARGCDDFRTDTRRPAQPNRPRGEEGALMAFADTVNAGDTLDIHGFASEEGPADYNEHLSCLRAIKAMSVLTAALTARGVSATMNLFKHGATASAVALRPERRSVVIDKRAALPPRPCSTAPPVCPIGTGGAPNLIDPHIPSGSLCRGACGPDCPPTCTSVPNITLCVPDSTGGCHFNCTYTGVIDCGSHLGCRDHDACFDMCAASEGEHSMLGPCHTACNIICARDYDIGTCNSWRQGGGPFDRRMQFSDPPTTTGPLPGSCPP